GDHGAARQSGRRAGREVTGDGTIGLDLGSGFGFDFVPGPGGTDPGVIPGLGPRGLPGGVVEAVAVLGGGGAGDVVGPALPGRGDPGTERPGARRGWRDGLRLRLSQPVAGRRRLSRPTNRPSPRGQVWVPGRWPERSPGLEGAGPRSWRAGA